jgi:hypothetical protein
MEDKAALGWPWTNLFQKDSIDTSKVDKNTSLTSMTTQDIYL